MKIDFSQELKTIEGDTLKRAKREGDDIVELPATLKWAAVEALLTTDPKAQTAGEEKARRYDLALSIQESTTPLDLSVDDLSFIKKLCDSHFSPLIVGQTRKALEGPSA